MNSEIEKEERVLRRKRKFRSIVSVIVLAGIFISCATMVKAASDPYYIPTKYNITEKMTYNKIKTISKKTVTEKKTAKKKAKKTYHTTKTTRENECKQYTIKGKTKTSIWEYTTTKKITYYTKGKKQYKVKTTTTVQKHTVKYKLSKSFKKQYITLSKLCGDRVPAKLRKRFESDGFKVLVDPTMATCKKWFTQSKVNTITGAFDCDGEIIIRQPNQSVYHELGHYVAYIAGQPDYSSEWEKIYRKEKNKWWSNESYTTSSAVEYFAETMKQYIFGDRKRLKKTSPKTYAYLKKICDKYVY